ncbi:MAG: hypothetical protein K2K84_10370, partial [Muribaculaceae bacterium]|nr:hypothetical protein [Muribaculaceae bacterium]
MKTKLIILLLCIITARINVTAQSDGQIFYYPVVANDQIPEKAKQSLTTKMDQILTQNGFGASTKMDRFVMLAKCNVLEKDIAPTTPPRISQKIEVTFILGDILDNHIFSSISFELKGLGTNETKAWQTAFNNLRP